MRLQDRHIKQIEAVQGLLQVDFHDLWKTTGWISDTEFAQEIHLGHEHIHSLKEQFPRR